MDISKAKKVFKISAEKIKEEIRITKDYEKNRIVALKILSAYLKEECSKNAYTMGGLQEYIKSLSDIPKELIDYLKMTKQGRFREDLEKTIIEDKGGSYSRFKLRKYWRIITKWYRCLPRKFFYYDDGSEYINPFTIPDNDLPLYVNRAWEDEYLAYVYKKRYGFLSADSAWDDKDRETVCDE